MNTKYNTILGKRFYNDDEVIRVLKYSNGDITISKDNNYYNTKKTVASELNAYNPLPPDLIYTFVHLITKETEDVLFYVMRKEDMEEKHPIPYVFGRQMIIESRNSTHISLGSYIYGKQYTKEDIETFMHCDDIIETVMVNSYKDDNIETIAKIAFNAFSSDMNKILNDNIITFIKNSRKKNFIGEVTGPTSLKSLVSIAQKVIDASIGIDYTFNKDDIEETQMVLGMITGGNYTDLDVILYKPDIDLDRITSEKFLMRNKADGNVYLYTYSSINDSFKN